jgi:hypothetical protein
LRQSGIAVDFRRIERGKRGLADFPSLDLNEFEAGSIITRTDRELTQMYRRVSDGEFIVLHAIKLSGSIGERAIVREIENLLSLRHPLIASPMGFNCVLGGERRELKIGRLGCAGGTLADVISAKPGWWTPTAKAKAVVGIALALRFAHGFVLLHGGVKASAVVFDADGRLQIGDFSGIRLESGDVDPFFGDEWSPMGDISAFSVLVFEIVVGEPLPRRTKTGEQERQREREWPPQLPPSVPTFVCEMIEDGLAAESGKWRRRSFIDIVELLKQHDFGIVSGVDGAEVSEFVEWAESSEPVGTIESCAAARIAPPVPALASPRPVLPTLRSPSDERGSPAVRGGGGRPNLQHSPLPPFRR